jgi:hypothetical protein
MINQRRSFPLTIVLLSIVVSAASAVPPRQTTSPVNQLVLPEGFHASVFAENVDNARQMVVGPQGTLFVGSRTVGKLHAVVDHDGDHKAERVVLIASGLDQPNGVAMRGSALYVATASRLLRSMTSSNISTLLPLRWSFEQIFRRPEAATPGNPSRSDRTACSTCRLDRRVMSARRLQWCRLLCV